MFFLRVSAFVALLGVLSPLLAQQPAPAVPAAAASATTTKPEWRSTSGYRFPAVAQTVADLQNLAYAMQLREFCANRRVPDAFVRDRLQRFSAMTGREEDCQSLRDY